MGFEQVEEKRHVDSSMLKTRRKTLILASSNKWNISASSRIFKFEKRVLFIDAIFRNFSAGFSSFVFVFDRHVSTFSYAILTAETWPKWTESFVDGVLHIVDKMHLDRREIQIGKTKIFIKSVESVRRNHRFSFLIDFSFVSVAFVRRYAFETIRLLRSNYSTNFKTFLCRTFVTKTTWRR